MSCQDRATHPKQPTPPPVPPEDKHYHNSWFTSTYEPIQIPLVSDADELKKKYEKVRLAAAFYKGKLSELCIAPISSHNYATLVSALGDLIHEIEVASK